MMWLILILLYTVNFWKDANNRRQVFISIAKKQGFDPLVPRNWYNIDEEAIRAHKV